MKYFFGLVVLIHAFIHSLGFIKAYAFAEIKSLTLPISKWNGILWLVAMLLLLIYIIAWFMQFRLSWLLGFCAVILSQLLIIAYWKDAKFGTLANAIIMLVSLVSYGSYYFQSKVDVELNEFIKQASSATTIFQDEEITMLPEPVKRWIRHTGAIGKPKIDIARIAQRAEMKMKPDSKDWLSATAVQFSTIDSPGFIWTVNAKMNAWLNFHGRDKFLTGRGEMLIKLYGLITIVNGTGQKINEGSLQRYLGEMIWLPNLAVSPYIRWQEVNDSTAIATMEYQGTKGSGTFYFNEEGDFVKFIALRYMGNEPDAERHEWILQVSDYAIFEGIKVPSKMTATWRLKDDHWTWLKLEVNEIRYNANALN